MPKEFIEYNKDGSVNDVVLNAESVHIEDLGDRIWIAVNRADGDRFTFEVGSCGTVFTRTACHQVEGSVGSLEAERD